jgi:hypothetical protein
MAATKTKKSSVPMSLEQLRKKVEEFESSMDKTVRAAIASTKGQWWHEHAGKFEGDPLFAQIVRLGREQRNGATRKTKRARPRH